MLFRSMSLDQVSNFYSQGKPLKNLYFGSYPYYYVHALLNKGIRVFVDVSNHREDELPEYSDKLTIDSMYIYFPIKDRSIPMKNEEDSVQFLISTLVEYINSGYKIYIHCKGGHGRSAVLTALVLRGMGYTPEKALKLVYESHQERPEMLERWRKIGAPQSKKQKDYVRNFPIKI